MATDTTNTTNTTATTPGQLALNAAIAAFQAQRETALAQISLFINNPAGVTDHNNFVEEIQTCVTKLAEANAALNTIRTTFIFAGEDTPTTSGEATIEPTNRF